MANYTAADVKALRERSGAGMMDCKNALDEANGDGEKAMEVLRLKGLKGVTKREGRTTSNGLVVARVSGGTGYLLELACETDFVAKTPKFVELADSVADAIAAAGADRRRPRGRLLPDRHGRLRAHPRPVRPEEQPCAGALPGRRTHP